MSKLLELHFDPNAQVDGAVGEDGVVVDRPDGYEPPIQENV